MLLKRVKDFQEYLERQTAKEKDEVTQLNVEQNELEACEQQLLNTAEDDDDEDEDEQTRQNLSAQLRNLVQGPGSLTKSPEPMGPMNEELQIELEHMRGQQELHKQALEKRVSIWPKRKVLDSKRLGREFFIGTRVRSWLCN